MGTLDGRAVGNRIHAWDLFQNDSAFKARMDGAHLRKCTKAVSRCSPTKGCSIFVEAVELHMQTCCHRSQGCSMDLTQQCNTKARRMKSAVGPIGNVRTLHMSSFRTGLCGLQ